ncbi:tetratricopeptide repeat protein [Tsukamurella soli]|uniref:Tetratricopeptide repeat-containing protein n=1 Tax=Tsukamurella soli TaxID=644556 RepID=A0ABP8JBL3_9ACTN
MTDPDSGAAVAEAYRSAGRFEEAITQARQVLATAPQHRAALTTLGWAAAAAERPRIAEDAARRLLAGGAPGVSPLLLLGFSLAGQKRTVEAVTAVNAAIAQEPGNAGAHRTRSLILCDADPRDALTSANIAVHLEPDAAQSHLAAARALLAMNNTRDARRALERTLELDPTDATATHLMAVVDGAQWRMRDGLRGLLRVGALDPQRAAGIAHTVRWMTRRAAIAAIALLALCTLLVLTAGTRPTPESAPSGAVSDTVTVGGRIGAGMAVLGVLAVLAWLILATPGPARRVLLRAVLTDVASVAFLVVIALWLACLVTAALVGSVAPLGIALGIVIVAGFVRLAAAAAGSARRR